MTDDSTSQLLALLHRGGRWAYWWTTQDKRSRWWPVGKPLPLPGHTFDTYYPVNPCSVCKKPGERGTIQDISAVNCLYAEVDAKDFGDDKASALDHLRSLPLAPTVIIDSGGGFHCYWVLKEPFLLQDDVGRGRARKIQARWVEFVNGDPGAKDLARILRVPGTFNHKYDPPRPVSFVSADLSRVFDLDQLEDLVGLSADRHDRTYSVLVKGNGHGNTHGAAYTRAKVDLAKLASWRCEQYESWLEVGMSLSELGAEGLELWDAWSQNSPKYQRGVCEEKWRTFAPGAGRTLGSLSYWAKQDNPEPVAQQDGGKKTVPTDDELARRWRIRHPLTAWGQGQYRRYRDGIWSPVHDDPIRREILGVIEGAKSEGIRPTSRLLNSVTELVRVKISVPPDQWDANPDILVCTNGALHIPSRELRAHDPEHYATSGVPYDYDPDALAPTWHLLLATSCVDSKDFLQEVAGYCLTIETKYEMAVWLEGQPGGGKSTFLAGLQTMLGARAGLLGLAEIEKSRFALTNLPGKTLMVSSEQPASFLSATHVLNALISGEPITVDMKFKDPVTIMPRAKLVWAMNELPRVGSSGTGLFRRVKVVRFPVIPESQRDPAVKDGVVREGAGILNWALDGLQRLRERGRFSVPISVTEASEQFRQSNDIPALFVADACMTGADLRTQAQVLYEGYRDWCNNNGHKPASSTAVAEDWKRLGFERRRLNGKTWWHGVAVPA